MKLTCPASREFQMKSFTNVSVIYGLVQFIYAAVAETLDLSSHL